MRGINLVKSQYDYFVIFLKKKKNHVLVSQGPNLQRSEKTVSLHETVRTEVFMNWLICSPRSG